MNTTLVIVDKTLYLIINHIYPLLVVDGKRVVKCGEDTHGVTLYCPLSEILHVTGSHPHARGAVRCDYNVPGIQYHLDLLHVFLY